MARRRWPSARDQVSILRRPVEKMRHGGLCADSPSLSAIGIGPDGAAGAGVVGGPVGCAVVVL